MLAYVKRTTIKVDDEIDARIRQEAQRRGVTVSEWIREAIAAHLPGRDSGDNGARTFRMAAAGASGQTDVSARFDEVLAELGFPGAGTDGRSA